jgi:hypothetical protein
MRAVGWLVGLVVLAGCSSGSAASSGVGVGAGTGTGVGTGVGTGGGTGQAAAVPDLPASPSPKELNAHLQAVLTTSGTGGFTQRTISQAKDGTVTMVLKGRFDLAAKSWKGRLEYQSDSTTFLKSTPLADLTANFIEVGANSFQNLPSRPGKDGKRWVKTSTPSATSFSGSATLLALIDLTPTTVRKQGKGWLLTGTVPAKVAMAALGLGEAQFDPADNADGAAALKGTGDVTVSVAADGTPTGLKISGSSVHLTTELPERIRQVLPGQRASLILRDVGKPVNIVAPTGAQLIK